MTSIYVLDSPHLDVQLYENLRAADPRFIVVLADVWPRFAYSTDVVQRRFRNANRAVNRLIAERYVEVDVVGRARIFARTVSRPIVSPLSSQTPP
jgi:hypothetical protein